MFHWIQDLQCPRLDSGDECGTSVFPFYLYHFLRCLGWKLIAERDRRDLGATPHVSDGSCDLAALTYWSAVGGGVPAKSTTQVYAGDRSLTFTATSTGDGVQSASFASMEASQLYAIGMAVYNNSGHQLKAYIDNGNGSWVLLGTIPDNAGTYTLQYWTYTSHSTVTACKVKVVTEDGAVSAGQVYIDSVWTCRDWFESRTTGKGTDGVIEAGNTFSSASYTFTADDVTYGRFVTFADFTNVGNSGFYPIASVSSGKAVLNLRDGGVASLVATTGLTFRVIDKANRPAQATESESGCGYCLESPHSSKWRFKVRNRWQTTSPEWRWVSSPEQCELNVDSFTFYKKQRSTARNMDIDAYGLDLDTHTFANTMMVASGTGGRYFVLTDGETFIMLAGRYLNSGTYTPNCAAFIGFLGDNNVPFDETFAHISEYGQTWSADSIQFDYTAYRWSYAAGGFNRFGLCAPSTVASMGYGTGADVVEYMSNAKANPWSGEEILRPLMLFIDYGATVGGFRLLESTIECVGHCRANLPKFQPFGTSSEWFHTSSGLCFAWNGRAVLP